MLAIAPPDDLLGADGAAPGRRVLDPREIVRCGSRGAFGALNPSSGAGGGRSRRQSRATRSEEPARFSPRRRRRSEHRSVAALSHRAKLGAGLFPVREIKVATLAKTGYDIPGTQAAPGTEPTLGCRDVRHPPRMLRISRGLARVPTRAWRALHRRRSQRRRLRPPEPS